MSLLKKVAAMLDDGITVSSRRVLLDLDRHEKLAGAEKVACEKQILAGLDKVAFGWQEALSAGAISAVPVSILAAIGYKNLKEDIAKRDQAMQAQLGNIQDISAVGAATNMMAMNQLYNQQGNSPVPGAMEGMKTGSLNEPLFEKLCAFGGQVHMREMLLDQAENTELSKEARDLACEMLDINRSKIVECLKGIVA